MEGTLFTLAELLAMPQFPGQELLTAAPLPEEVLIRHVSVIEPPVGEFVRPGELVLTTALGCARDSDFLSFIRDLREAGAAAVAVTFEDGCRFVPPSVLAYAREQRLPLIRLPWALRFADIVESVLGRIRAAREQAATRWEGLQARMLSLYLGGGTLTQALALLAGETWCDVLLTDRSGRSLGTTAPSASGWKLLLPVRAQGQDAGAVFLSGTRATPEYLDSLTVWAPYILTPLLLWLDRDELQSAAQDQLREELVRSLSEGVFPDTEDNRARARLLGLRIGQPAVCLAAPSDGFSEDICAYLRLLLRTHVSAPAAMTARGAVIYLAPDEPPERTAQMLSDALAARFPSAQFWWGTSGAGSDRAELCRDALLAAGLCRRENGKRVYGPADTRLYRLLRCSLDDKEARAAREPLLSPLRSYDETHGGELREALLGWFDSGCNACEAARMLHLHRQSLRYRLGKAEELVGFPLSDHRQALVLELALRMDQMC